ncbi:AAA family ATPase [Deinococcus apachensis]|uniref:AAA family ATPase n=1 Tax=Deinococcus apachensis TaxID=309886 RepID=UPI000A05AAEC|nr:AAA family ATPase [Deinococcus apachensis]
MSEAGPGIDALHGFIGSGKTTLAWRLEGTLPGMRFSSDEWRVALYGADRPPTSSRCTSAA